MVSIASEIKRKIEVTAPAAIGKVVMLRVFVPCRTAVAAYQFELYGFYAVAFPGHLKKTAFHEVDVIGLCGVNPYPLAVGIGKLCAAHLREIRYAELGIG